MGMLYVVTPQPTRSSSPDLIFLKQALEKDVSTSVLPAQQEYEPAVLFAGAAVETSNAAVLNLPAKAYNFTFLPSSPAEKTDCSFIAARSTLPSPPTPPPLLLSAKLNFSRKRTSNRQRLSPSTRKTSSLSSRSLTQNLKMRRRWSLMRRSRRLRLRQSSARSSSRLFVPFSPLLSTSPLMAFLCQSNPTQTIPRRLQH